MRKSLLFIGPVLFLIAQIILPQGSAEAVARSEIIQNNLSAWNLGHQLILLAFVFLMLWLMEVYGAGQGGSEWAAYIGLLLSVFALCADYGVGVLQLHASNLVQQDISRWAQPILAMMSQDQGLLLFAYLPTLGFVPGFGLLAFALYRHNRQIVPAGLLAVAGLLIAVAGMAQLKLLFVTGAAALLLFTVLFARLPARMEQR